MTSIFVDGVHGIYVFFRSFLKDTGTKLYLRERIWEEPILMKECATSIIKKRSHFSNFQKMYMEIKCIRALMGIR